MGYFLCCCSVVCVLSGSMKHSIECWIHIIFVRVFFPLSSTLFLCPGLYLFCHVWPHSFRQHSIQSVWSAIWISCFDSLQFLPIFIFGSSESFFILSQRQSILLPTEWPCIFSVFFFLSLSIAYHMFTFWRICSGF